VTTARVCAVIDDRSRGACGRPLGADGALDRSDTARGDGRDRRRPGPDLPFVIDPVTGAHVDGDDYVSIEATPD
jgi:hypothetical protein